MRHSIFQSKYLSEAKATLQLAIPLAAAQLAQAATSFFDTVMMGLLGSQILAAGGLGAVTFGTLMLISSGIVSAVGAIAAVAYGSGETKRLSRLTAQGLWLSVILCVALMPLLWHMGSLLVRFGQDPNTVQLTQSYLRAILWGCPAALGFAVFRNILCAVNRTRPVMAIVIASVLLNITGNYVLMFGKLGFPELGLAGIGWSSTFSLWVMFVAAASFIAIDKSFKTYNIFHHWYRFYPKEFREIVQIGWPIGVLFAVEAGLFAVTTFLMGSLGSTSLAAHNVALQTASITFMVPVGIAQATTVRVGQAIGKNNPIKARKAGYVGIALGGAFMGIMAILMWTHPDTIVGLYLDIDNPDNQQVVELAISLLGVGAMFQIFDGIQAIASGALRGLKDTQVPMLIGIFSYWCVGLLGGYLMGIKLHWGGVGLWLGLAIGLAFAAGILTARFTYLLSGKAYKT